jgi:hypothetical protein
MIKQFYEKALPTQGVYCVAGIKSGVVKQRFVNTLEEIEREVTKFKDSGSNVYVAPNSFNNFSRSADNAAYSRSFFIDLDVGPTKEYFSVADAESALQTFVDDNELPPPVRIMSGTGLQAYWLFDSNIAIAEWKIYSAKFKKYCISHGLKIDPTVTADAARIMRCPDTYNYKTDPPNPTRVMDTEINLYDFEAFKEFLGVTIFTTSSIDEDTQAIAKATPTHFENTETLFEIIAQKSVDDEGGCAQIKNILENAKTLSEPLWHSGLSIARECSDWETAIHLMSEDYAGYNREATIIKAQQTLGKPHSCTEFENRNPGGCNGCQHRGKITNPLALGRKLKEGSTEITIRSNADTEKVFKFPPLDPFSRGPAGGVYFTPKREKDEETGEWSSDTPIQLTEYDFYPVKRMYSAMDGECLLMRNDLPHDGEREFLLPMNFVTASDKFKDLLSRSGVVFDLLHTNHLTRYVQKWMKHMIRINKAEQMRMQMGWTENKESFVIGNNEYTRDGEILQSAASPFVRNIAKLLTPTGTYETWQYAANSLNEAGFEQHAFVMMAGFGATLMNMTSTSGVTICLSGKSGMGKTGALYAALSPWGNPKELSVFDATDNGMIGRYLGLRNIPLGCDEVSNKKGDQLSNLIHRVSHGKSKIRMQASVNAEREIEFSASTIAILTTNKSVKDTIQHLKASPDGEMARVVEFNIDRVAPLIANPKRGKEIFDLFRTNYCWAGAEFIKHYYKVGEPYVQSLIDKWTDRFIAGSFGHDTAYRFYQNMVGATFAAGELKNEANITKLDLERIYHEIVLQLISLRDEIKINKLDYKNLISEFVNMNQRNFLVMDDNRIIDTPYGPLVGRIEIHTSRIYISKTEVKKYLSQLQVNAREFEFATEEAKLLVYNGKQRLGTGWKANLGPVAVYGFKTDIPEEFLTRE